MNILTSKSAGYYKILLTFLFVFFLQRADAQKISIHVKNAPIKTVIRQLKKQSGYQFFYNNSFLKNTKPVNVDFQNMELKQALALCFSDQPLSYEIINKTVVLKLLENNSAVVTGSLPEQEITIHGVVKDERGLPFENVTVVNKKKRYTTMTDVDGNYQILASKGDSLKFTFVGYNPILIYIGKESLMNVKMSSQVSQLDQVQVIGYGQTTQRLSTGNVGTVTAKDIEKQPISDVFQALQGRVSGLEVKSTSGFFSGNYSVKIRGTNAIPVDGSPNAVSDPLYIVDGVPITIGNGDQRGFGVNQNGLTGPAGGQNPLLWLNPSDIQSISVLKDADATAIYGARGANGVILITTKKAKAGPTEISATVFTGYDMQLKKLKLMNTQQYVAMREEALKNDGLTPDQGNAYDLLDWDTTKYTNWQKVLLKTSVTTDMQLGINGGDEKTSFRFNTGYHRETPPFPGNFSDQRISNVLGLTHSALNGKLKANLNLNFAGITSDLPQTDPTQYIFTAPDAPGIYNASGHLNYDAWRAVGYPVGFAALEQPYKATTINFASNLVVNYNFLPGFKLNLSGGYNISRQNQLSEDPGSSQDPESTIIRTTTFGHNNSKVWLFEPTLNWSKTFNEKHHIDVLVGSTYQESVIDGDQITASGFVSDNLMENLSAASSFFYPSSSYAKTRIQSYYGRITYNFNNKYIVDFNGRRDGSSRFGPGNQYGTFGAVGAAWIFSQENLFKESLPFLSFGKLRGSYGTTGGDAIGDYAYLSLFSTGSTYAGSSALTITNAFNANYKWTVNKKLDASLNLGFLKDRILFNVSYYRNRTGNQIVSYPLPTATGYASVVANLPAVVQNNGWEFELTTKNIEGKFNWTTSANLSISRNKLLSFPGLANSTYSYLYTIGQSINRTELFHFLGVDPATGQILIQDKNNDGSIDYGVDQDYYDSNPSFTGGIQNTFNYGRFGAGLFFMFVKTKGLNNAYNFVPGYINENQTLDVLKRWRKAGDVTSVAAFTTYPSDVTDQYLNSDALWGDASYIRLQNAYISYELPTDSWHFKKAPRAVISIQGENLFTITDYKGADPAQAGAALTLPSRTVLTAKLQVTF